MSINSEDLDYISDICSGKRNVFDRLMMNEYEILTNWIFAHRDKTILFYCRDVKDIDDHREKLLNTFGRTKDNIFVKCINITKLNKKSIELNNSNRILFICNSNVMKGRGINYLLLSDKLKLEDKCLFMDTYYPTLAKFCVIKHIEA